MTKHHKDRTKGDYPLSNIISEFEKIYNGNCPRFLHPMMLIKHYELLKHVRNSSLQSTDDTTETFGPLFQEFSDLVANLSDKTPYYGKLSFRFTGMILVAGWVRFLSAYDYYDFKVSFDFDAEIERMKTMTDMLVISI